MAGEEKKLENQIKKYLKDNGAYIVKYHGGTYSKSGVPDLLVCYRGIFLGLEIKKSSGGKVTELQEYHINQIQDAGGYASIICTMSQLFNLLSYIDEVVDRD